MDIKNKTSAGNFIFSFLFLIFPILIFIGLFSEQIQLIYNGAKYEGYNTIEMFKTSFSILRNTSGDPAVALGDTPYLIYVLLFITCGVLILIHSILLIVKTIIGMVKPIDSKRITRHLISISIAIAVYVCVTMGCFHYGYRDTYMTIGAGPIILLVVASISILLVIIIHLSEQTEQKMVNKVFHGIICLVAYIGTICAFISFLDINGGIHIGLIYLIFMIFREIANNGGTNLFGIFIFLIISLALLSVMLGFIPNIIEKSLHTKVKGEDPEVSALKREECSRSLIIKSALWQGFAVIGIIILYITVESLYPDYTYTLGLSGILMVVLSSISLGLSIANKVIENNNKK